MKGQIRTLEAIISIVTLLIAIYYVNKYVIKERREGLFVKDLLYSLQYNDYFKKIVEEGNDKKVEAFLSNFLVNVKAYTEMYGVIKVNNTNGYINEKVFSFVFDAPYCTKTISIDGAKESLVRSCYYRVGGLLCSSFSNKNFTFSVLLSTLEGKDINNNSISLYINKVKYPINVSLQLYLTTKREKLYKVNITFKDTSLFPGCYRAYIYYSVPPCSYNESYINLIPQEEINFNETFFEKAPRFEVYIKAKEIEGKKLRNYTLILSPLYKEVSYSNLSFSSNYPLQVIYDDFGIANKVDCPVLVLPDKNIYEETYYYLINNKNYVLHVLYWW